MVTAMRRMLRSSWVIPTVLLVFVGVAAAAPKPPIIPTEQRRFNHDRHAEVAANARDPRRRPAGCVSCHKLDGQGQPVKGKEHTTRCVDCHSYMKNATCTNEMRTSKAATNPSRACVSCHVFDRCKPAGMPLPPPIPTYQASFSHGRHIGFGAAIEKDCARCHTSQAPAAAPKVAGAGHASCKDCHAVGGRSRLVMTDCEGCHKPQKGKAGPSTDPFRLARFDHRMHHRLANQTNCTMCHTPKKMQGAGDAAVPRPDMLTCVTTCHDGSRAFSAVGTKCTTCHTNGAGQPAQPNRTDTMFSHAAHASRNVDITKCGDCHQLKPDGNLEPHGTNKNHTPCANSGCHQNEFASKTTKICGVCHDSSMPWQKAIARTREPPKPEWFENMNHKSHLQKKGATNAACGDCHGDKLGGGKKPGDHEACSQCHGKGAPAHPMTDCAKCHVKTPPERAPVTEWSVRATFEHEQHATDPKSKKQNECASCHADVKFAKDLASIKKPTMESCGRCHDGKLTFKTTGYECSKCHTPPKEGSTPTAFQGLMREPGSYEGLTALSLQDIR
jgi:c(7)-type cytochrome triheme protein